MGGRTTIRGPAGALVTASLLFIGCNAGSDTSAPTTTAAVAPPTTTPASASTQPAITNSTSAPATTIPTTTTSTTLPTTTVAATTQPPPTITLDAAVSERALDYKRAVWKCLEQADQCDVDKVVAEYFIPSDLAEQVEASMDEWIAEGQRSTKTEQITISVKRVSVAPDGLNAATTTCIRNGAITVNSDTDEVIDDEIGYSREETVWASVGQKWMIADKTTYTVRPGEDDACGF